ncbi:hypothetical protein C8D78_3761 [Arthrobacter oryzae]|uniref:Uncharacterized protein n=1 Tax=Arthrobacter oryzae TaxID=409290 RepID=A0A495E6U2_9MICC|nr:hypothetical protein C8D78_3761 [Arthrobacter oryzae]
MALDRTSLRTDIGYLSRRRKAAAQPEPRPAAQTTATSPELGTSRPSPSGLTLGANRARSGGLTLDGRPAPTPSAKASVTPGPGPGPVPSPSERFFPAPDFGSVRELGEANPVVRLNARQSAIGSLLVTGVRSVAWEDQQLTAGAHHVDGHKAGTAVVTPGNRPLAGVQDAAGIVSLRHVRLLRRVLFVAGETPLTVGVFDGAAAAVAARNDAGLRSVLYVARVGALLELRAEFVAADASDAAIWAIFGFNMTIPLDQRVLRR